MRRVLGGERSILLDRPVAERRDDSVVPEFRLPTSTGQTLGLDSFLGKVPMIFVFLDPEARSHRNLAAALDGRLKDFGEQRTQVLVVMRVMDGIARRIADEENLNLPILADAQGELARALQLDLSEDKAVAVIADRSGSIVRRYDRLAIEDPEGTAQSLVTAAHPFGSGNEARGSSSNRLEPTAQDDGEFWARVAEEAHVSSEEAPAVVASVLLALAPSLNEEARDVIDDLLPEGLQIPRANADDSDDDVEDVLLAALDESSIATGRPVEHARVVTEALSRRAGPDQLKRLRDSVEDEGVLALFETTRGELTLDHQTTGAAVIQSTTQLAD